MSYGATYWLLWIIRHNHYPAFRRGQFHHIRPIAQVLTSAVVDQFGLFGMARRPIEITKLAGLVVIVAGIAVMEIGNLTKARP